MYKTIKIIIVQEQINDQHCIQQSSSQHSVIFILFLLANNSH